MKILEWDNHNINDGTNYEAIPNADIYGLPGVSAALGQRHGRWPLIGGIERPGRAIVFDIYIRGSSIAALQKDLALWFDPEDETPKRLQVSDSDGATNKRYIFAICEELKEVPFSAGLHFVVSLKVHGDIRFRRLLPSSDSWSVTATGQTQVIANNGETDAYLRMVVKPTSAKTGTFEGYAKKRFITVLWSPTSAINSYPTDIVDNAFDSATEVSGGDMQADGDDLRVYVNGVEVDRWLDDINTNNTSVWVNLDWSGDIPLILNGAHDISQTTFYIDWDISNMPSEGIILIDSELVTYTGKNNQEKKFTGCTRGAKGSTAATHTNGTTVYWVQHEIWLLYGNSALSAPDTDDNYKPMFELATSLNTTWDYDNFLEDDGLRTGSWIFALTSPISSYGGDHGANADPWVEIGLEANGRRPSSGHWGRVYIYNPAGITNANFQNGEKYIDDELNEWGTAKIESSPDGSNWGVEYIIPVPTTKETWQAWSDNTVLTSGSKYVGFWMENMDEDAWLECADVTLTITDPFTHTIGSEIANYQLAFTLTNNTTGDAIKIDFPLLVDEELEIDTDEKTVVYLTENSNQFQALTLVGGARRDWLKLQPGNNTIQYDEIGLAAVYITANWEMRYYQ